MSGRFSQTTEGKTHLLLLARVTVNILRVCVTADDSCEVECKGH